MTVQHGDLHTYYLAQMPNVDTLLNNIEQTLQNESIMIPEAPKDFNTAPDPTNVESATDAEKAKIQELRKTLLAEAERAKHMGLQKSLQEVSEWLKTSEKASIHDKLESFDPQRRLSAQQWASTGVSVVLPPAFGQDLIFAKPKKGAGHEAIEHGFSWMDNMKEWHTQIRMSHYLVASDRDLHLRDVGDARRMWSQSKMEVTTMCTEAETALARTKRESEDLLNNHRSQHSHLEHLVKGKNDKRRELQDQAKRLRQEIADRVAQFHSLVMTHKQLGEEITAQTRDLKEAHRHQREAAEQVYRQAEKHANYVKQIKAGMDLGEVVLHQIEEAHKSVFGPPLELVKEALERAEKRHDQCYCSVDAALKNEQEYLPMELAVSQRALNNARNQEQDFAALSAKHTAAQTTEEFQKKQEKYRGYTLAGEEDVRTNQLKIKKSEENRQLLQTRYALFKQPVQPPPPQQPNYVPGVGIAPQPTAGPWAHSQGFAEPASQQQHPMHGISSPFPR